MQYIIFAILMVLANPSLAQANGHEIFGVDPISIYPLPDTPAAPPTILWKSLEVHEFAANSSFYHWGSNGDFYLEVLICPIYSNFNLASRSSPHMHWASSAPCVSIGSTRARGIRQNDVRLRLHEEVVLKPETLAYGIRMVQTYEPRAIGFYISAHLMSKSNAFYTNDRSVVVFNLELPSSLMPLPEFNQESLNEKLRTQPLTQLIPFRSGVEFQIMNSDVKAQFQVLSH